jgi:hypothetical protein
LEIVRRKIALKFFGFFNQFIRSDLPQCSSYSIEVTEKNRFGHLSPGRNSVLTILTKALTVNSPLKNQERKTWKINFDDYFVEKVQQVSFI